MDHFVELAPGVFHRPSLLYATATAVVVGESSLLVVDPGYFEPEIAAARQLADRFSHGRARHILLTHSDFDHVVGLPAFPDYTLVRSGAWPDGSLSRALAAARAFDQEHHVLRQEAAYAVEVHQPTVVAADGAGVQDLTLLAAPGHTPDGLMAYHAPSRALILGDYLSALEFPLVDDFPAYLATLSRLAAFLEEREVTVAVAGHGPPCLGPEGLKERLRQDASYLKAIGEAAAASFGRHGPHPRLAELVAARTADAWQGRPIPPALWQEHLQSVAAAVRWAEAGGGGVGWLWLQKQLP
jgi:hydroxyacylglutathione hydrolase